MNELTVKTPGGIGSFRFLLGVSTGSDPNCYPGIGLSQDVDPQFLDRHGKVSASTLRANSVMSRRDAALLRDMLTRFLERHPPVEATEMSEKDILAYLRRSGV